MNRIGIMTAAVALSATAGLVGACGEQRGGGDGARLAIEMLPLALPGVGDVEVGLAVYNADGELVWDAPSLWTSVYGAAGAGLAYVGPCDATPAAGGGPAMNTVQLVIRSMKDEAGQPIAAESWVNPAPAVAVTDARALVRRVACLPNRDAEVRFDITLARDAGQGFVDVTVELEDVFCSAKLDCVDALLHDPETRARGRTAVMGFACAGGDGQPVTMYLSQIQITCVDGAATTFSHSFPAAALAQGNQAGASPLVFASAHYWGQEGFADFDKCYWNHAYGIDVDALAGLGTCTLEAWGAASSDYWTDLTTPVDAVYPVVHWSVELTRAGAVTCGAHPLLSDEVAVEYTRPPARQPFASSYVCGADPLGPAGAVACLGGDAIAEIDAAGALTVTVMVAGQPVVATLPTEPGTRIQGDCCVHACCQ